MNSAIMLIPIAIMISLASIGSVQSQPVQLSSEGKPVSRFLAMKLSPRADLIAFVTLPQGARYGSIHIQPVGGGTPISLNGLVAWPHLPDPPEYLVKQRQEQVAWSPDGNRLAYLALDDQQVLRLWVWDRRKRQSAANVPDVIACGETTARNSLDCYNPLQWTSDGGAIYFLGKSEDSKWLKSENLDATPRTVTPRGDMNEIEVRKSPQPPATSSTRSNAGGDIFKFDVASRGVHRLTQDGEFSYLLLSPDGKQLLAVQRRTFANSLTRDHPKQAYLDYYIIPPAPNESTSFDSTQNERESIKAQPERIVDSALQMYPVVSWSPDGDKFAYIEHGGASDGDVKVYNLRSRRLINATEGYRPGTDNVAGAATLNKHLFYPGSKFGTLSSAPEWSSGGSELFLTRQERTSKGWRTSLWTLSLISGEVSSVFKSPDCEVLKQWRSENSREGYSRDRSGVLAYCEGGQSKLLSIGISGQNGKLMRIFAGDKPRFVNVSNSGVIALVQESPVKGGEVYLLRPDEDGFAQLTHINDDVAELKTIHSQTVVWKGSSGETLWGKLLYSGRTDASKAPLIAWVYPADPYDIGVPRYKFVTPDEDLTRPARELLNWGFVIFVPKLPIRGNGGTCAGVVADLNNAIAKINEQHLADTAKAGIIGHSFGGWTVNCVVTHSTLFKAAVSVSGLSDLISSFFSDINRPLSWGGGQMNIGGDLDDRPMLYWHESPIANTANVTTPLLLIHGKQDHTVAYQQSVEMFNGLFDRNKQTELVLYEHLGHHDILDQPDVVSRICTWFNRYLN